MGRGDGGPAFPKPGYIHEDGTTEWFPGELSLRDYFAAKALQGLLASETDQNPIPTQRDGALLAYEYADAMLVARGSAGPEIEAEREAKIEAWLERDKLRDALSTLLQAAHAASVTPYEGVNCLGCPCGFEEADDEKHTGECRDLRRAIREAETADAPKPLSPQLGGSDPGPAAGRGPGLPQEIPAGPSPATGSEDGRPVERPGGSSARKEQA